MVYGLFPLKIEHIILSTRAAFLFGGTANKLQQIFERAADV